MPKYFNQRRYSNKNNPSSWNRPDLQKRHYGFFRCDDCNAKWESSWVYENQRKGGYWTQDCKQCNTAVMPHKVESIKCRGCGLSDCICSQEEREERHNDASKPHRSDLCSRCRAGYPCAKR